MALQDYLSTREVLDASSPLWLNDDNRRLQFFGLRELVKRLCKRSGVQSTGALHAFRRTFAITMFRSGADLLSISRLLGHCNIEITKRYLNVNDNDLRLAHAKASPGDILE